MWRFFPRDVILLPPQQIIRSEVTIRQTVIDGNRFLGGGRIRRTAPHVNKFLSKFLAKHLKIIDNQGIT
jgi:hypothetical protein